MLGTQIATVMLLPLWLAKRLCPIAQWYVESSLWFFSCYAQPSTIVIHYTAHPDKTSSCSKKTSLSTKASVSASGKCFAFMSAPSWLKQPNAPFWPSGLAEGLATAEGEVIIFPVLWIFTPSTLLSNPTAHKWQAPCMDTDHSEDMAQEEKVSAALLLPWISSGCGQSLGLNQLYYYLINAGLHVYYLAHFKLHWAES